MTQEFLICMIPEENLKITEKKTNKHKLKLDRKFEMQKKIEWVEIKKLQEKQKQNKSLFVRRESLSRKLHRKKD